MKKQIRRLSPHQNGKVFGVLIAVSSFIVIVPLMVFLYWAAPSVDKNGNPLGPGSFAIASVALPLVYLVFGYLSMVIGCAVYNFLFKYIGGIEFEFNGEETQQNFPE